MMSWSPHSWKNFLCHQAIEYLDDIKLSTVLRTLDIADPLISYDAMLKLQHHLLEAYEHRVFLLQAGDCAEVFKDITPHHLQATLTLLEKLRACLEGILQKPVIIMGRMAGQYAKARTSLYETIETQTLPSYRGELINHIDFSEKARQPDPKRLLEGYHYSQITLQAMKPIQNLFSSHEALHLPFEAALTRWDADSNTWWLASTHFPWLGIRTQNLDGAHIEFLRGIANPIGLKINAQCTPKTFIQSLLKLNPKRIPGKIVVITRLGAENVHTHLPRLIEAAQTHQIPLLWSCDPMHGNTYQTALGLKTRHFNTMLHELVETHRVHRTFKSHLNGIHLELTAKAVTECLDATDITSEENLHENYQSVVDPRLNATQSQKFIEQFAQAYVSM